MNVFLMAVSHIMPDTLCERAKFEFMYSIVIISHNRNSVNHVHTILARSILSSPSP